MNDEVEMAQRFFGDGCWKAPYWFIGPEEGKGPREPVDNASRVDAWVKLGKCELCDCKAFHHQIGETRWHRELRDKPVLQRTLAPSNPSFLNKPAGQDDLRDYQRDSWGRQNGRETCIIELSGLGCKSSSRSKRSKAVPGLQS